MDLVVLPVRKRVSSYGLKKAEMVKQLGENVWQCVEREKKKCIHSQQTDKGHYFWVWWLNVDAYEEGEILNSSKI